MKRVLFLYNHNFDHEIEDFQAGRVPAHRLFGYAALQRDGWTVSHCPWPRGFRKRPYSALAWRCYQALWSATNSHRFDAVVATHEASAMPVLALKELGLCRNPLVLLNVALLAPGNLSGKRFRITRRLLRRAEAIVSYASAQSSWLASRYDLPETRLHHIPFCVDTEYFAQQPPEPNSDFVLSTGTNLGKDFSTLISALPSDIKLLVITDSHNSEVIRNTRRPGQQITVIDKGVPIEQLRELYCRARFHVIPLLETEFSSGQTVLLENMSLGKVVITSDVSAVSDYVRAGETAVMVPPADPKAMAQLLRAVWDRYSDFATIGERAASEVRANASTAVFAQRLGSILGHVANPRRK